MPLLTRFYIRTALLYLVAALTLGAALLAGQSNIPAYRDLQIVYFHLFMVGWATQLIFGVAWWMFPIFSLENPRGNERFAWCVYVGLNVGLILRAIAEGGHHFYGNLPSEVLLRISAMLQVLAVLIYVVQLWPRVGLLERRQKKN
jgi:hypothetical protein